MSLNWILATLEGADRIIHWRIMSRRAIESWKDQIRLSRLIACVLGRKR